jgi:hypothetical protein
MQKILPSLVPVLLKVVLPPLLGGVGALAAVAWSEGFRAFCGL